MPQITSAKKELRKNITRRARNMSALHAIKSILKEATKAIHVGDAAKAAEAYRRLQKAVDKATKVGILKPNTANRKKSRLAARISKAVKK